MAACFSGHEQCALALIKAGANVNAAEEDGWTALMHACDGGHEQCARALIEAGANIEATDEHDWTALMFACEDGHDLCARTLLENGAAIDAVTRDGATSLMLASQNGNEACVNLLIELGAAVNLAMNADAPDGEGSFTALISACMNAHQECAIRLLAAGANAESQSLSLGSAHAIAEQSNLHRVLAVITAGHPQIRGSPIHLP